MKLRILAPVFLILAIVCIALFFIMAPTYITENGDMKHFEDNDLSFDFSKNWTVYDYDDALKTLFLSGSPNTLIINPGDSSQYSYYEGDMNELTDNGTAVINTSSTNAFDVAIVKTEITKHDSLPEGITLDNAYKSDSLYKLMDGSGQLILTGDSELEIDGKKAHQFNYTVTYTSYTDTWVEHNGHYFRVLSQAPTQLFSQAEPYFTNIVDTLKIK